MEQTIEGLTNLVHACQIAISQMGKDVEMMRTEIMKMQSSASRDTKDQWTMIADVTTELKKLKDKVDGRN